MPGTDTLRFSGHFSHGLKASWTKEQGGPALKAQGRDEGARGGEGAAGMQPDGDQNGKDPEGARATLPPPSCDGALGEQGRH